MTSRCQGLFPPHPFFKGLNVGYINEANIFILLNGVGQDLRAKNKEIGGERASLSHSATQRKELRRPTIVLDTTAYISMCNQMVTREIIP